MAQFGMIGLGTMGRNLAYNVADHNFSVCGYDRDEVQRNRFVKEAPANKSVTAAASLQEFVNALETPRKIMLLVPAGKIVDAVLNDLVPLLQKDDIVIDGGNRYRPALQSAANNRRAFYGHGGKRWRRWRKVWPQYDAGQQRKKL
jgi:6-phosphogluconate dehydrogenase